MSTTRQTKTQDRRTRVAPRRSWENSSSAPGLIALTLTGVVFIAWVAFLLTTDTDFLYVATAFAVSAIPFGLASFDSQARLMHPLNLVGVSLLFGTAGQTIYLAVLAEGPERYSLLSGVGDDGLSKALVVLAVGIVALAVGYVGAPPTRSTEPGRLLRQARKRGMGTPDPVRLTWVVAALVVVSVIAFVRYAPQVDIHGPADLFSSRKRFIDVGGETTVLGYYRAGISLASIAFVLVAFAVASRRVPIRSALAAWGAVALAITVMTAFATSSRSALFLTLATGALVVVAVRQREPRPALVILAVAAGLALLTVLAGFRAVGQDEATDLGEALGERTFLQGVVASRDWVDIGPLSAVVARVPDKYDYQYGLTLVSVLWAPVPRVVWPDKPAVRLGPEIAPIVYEFPDQRRSGDPPGLVGELWLNGGLIVVALGMAIFGFALRRLERWNELVHATAGLSGLLYGVVGVQIALRLPRADVTGVAIELLLTVPVIFLALWLARDRTPLAS